MPKIPTPGSNDAVKSGCKCPVMDNAHGKGSGYVTGINKEPTFWIERACPLHGMDVTEEQASAHIRKLAMKRIGL